MSATTARSAAPDHRQRCSITHATELASTRRRILSAIPGSARLMLTGGYNKLYEPDRQPGLILKAARWVHARRPFFVLADLAENSRRKAQGRTPAVITPLALEAV